MAYNEKTERTIVPAHPGWFVCLLIEAGTNEKTGETWPASLEREPIVAWQVERREGDYAPGIKPGERWIRHEVMPITLDGNPESEANSWCILRSDGKYEIPFDCTVQTEADAIAQLQGLRT